MPLSFFAARAHTLVTVTAACALSLTACGADDDGPSGSDAAATEELAVLTEDDLGQVLLSEAAMGPGFTKVDSDDEEDGDDDLGCFTDIGEEFDEAEEVEAASAEVDYEARTDFELPAVTMAAVSFDDVDEADDRIDRFRDAIDGCERVDVTDDEDVTTQLDITVDDSPYTNLVDEQLNIAATGTVESGLEFPISLEFTIARVDNNVVFFAFTDIVEDAGDATRTYSTALIERLVAVAEGEEPADSLITVSDPGDSEGLPSDDSTGAGSVFSKLPLDGGSYTWDSGVKMSLTVEAVEPYGERDDFCGDGSCGIAVPEDTRVALKYEVTVPDDFAEAFDPYGCPGELHVADGNDDEAFGLVSGDYMRSLDGSILPGTTKFGVQEFYIKADYADAEFYIESSCGDTDFSESAFFSGTFDS